MLDRRLLKSLNEQNLAKIMLVENDEFEKYLFPARGNLHKVSYFYRDDYYMDSSKIIATIKEAAPRSKFCVKAKIFANIFA